MAVINHHFSLDGPRINRLNGAGIHSIRELAAVLAALDLRAVVYLEEVDVEVLSSPEKKESQPE